MNTINTFSAPCGRGWTMAASTGCCTNICGSDSQTGWC